MTQTHNHRFPNETDEYRRARNALLEAEIELRRQIADVAKKRQALPDGGVVTEDYVFEGKDGATSLSALFMTGQKALVVYSFMFAPGGTPCPMCTSVLDGLNGSEPHISQRVSLAVVAKASVDEMQAYANRRGWHNLRMYSAGSSDYSRHYLGENDDGVQMPALNVFTRRNGGIVHTYCTEMLVAKAEPGQDPRHVDMIWPVWNMLDFTPEGRGDWYPEVTG